MFISPDPQKNAAPLFTHFRKIGTPGVSRAEESQNGRGEDVPKTKKSCRKRLKSTEISAGFSVIGVKTAFFLPIAFRNVFYGKTSTVFRCFSSFSCITAHITVKCEGGQKTENGEKVRGSPPNRVFLWTSAPTAAVCFRRTQRAGGKNSALRSAVPHGITGMLHGFRGRV